MTYYSNNLKLDEAYKLEISQPINDFTPLAISGSNFLKDYRYKRGLKISLYDQNGNILEQSKENDIMNSYLWSYNNLYPIAHVIGAQYSEISYTSFETGYKGNWSYSGTTSVNSSSPSGGYVYSLNSTYPISKADLQIGEYRLSYWSSNTGSPYTVTGTTANSVSATLLKNGWKYYEHIISTNGSISITGAGLIDELRIYPINAKFSSRTFIPMIGVSTELDNNSIFKKYIYDDFNRLIQVYDIDGKLNSLFCYKNYNKLDACGEFGNDEQSGVFTKQCTSPGIGQQITYTVPAGKFTSVISKLDANNMAINDVQLNGQAYANEQGLCQYFNEAQTKSFTKQGCTPPAVGETLSFTIPANSYSSTISLADANSLAISALDLQGQLYANSNGSCIGGTTGVYAKIVYSNVVHDELVSTADFYINFYSDQNCTVPLSVSNVTVNYAQTRTICTGGGATVTNFSKLCSGNTVYLGNLNIRLTSGSNCYAYDYSVKIGTGYYPCGYTPPIEL